jgi:mRNA interferase MazF
MTNYQPGDVLLVIFPFVQGGQGKQRPALVIADTGDSDIVMARITTQAQHTPFDIQLADWKAAGLMAPSAARLHKLATINKSLIQRRLGALTNADRSQVAAAFAKLCSGW